MSLSNEDLQAINIVVQDDMNPIEGKLLSLHEDLIDVANQAGIVLPSH